MAALLGNESIALRAVDGLVDQSGNGFDGTYVGDTAVVADTGEGGTEAYEFDGTGDWISVGDVITPTNKLSLACWVKLDTIGVSQSLMSQDGDSGNFSWSLISLVTDGVLRVVLSNNGTNIIVVQTNSAVLTVGAWHHVAMVYDGAAPSISLYVDGAIAASSIMTTVGTWLATIPSAIHNSTSPVLFGARARTGSPLAIDGRADDFRVWTSAISSANIANIGASRGDVAASVSLNTQTRIVQRGDNLSVSGSYFGDDATDVQLRVLLASDNSVVTDWTTIDSTLSDGAWSGSVTIASGGPYYLQARLRDSASDVIATSSNSATVLVGDVIVCTGQSNMLGRGVAQTYSGTQPIWHVREDGDIVESIDDPSSDNSADVDGAGPLGIGSMRPLLADLIAADQECPVIMLINAKGGQAISNWNRPSGAMWTAFEAMAAVNPTSVKAIIWYQGETDAHGSTTETSYQASEASLIAAMQGEFSNTPPVITALLGESNTTSNQDRINKAKLTNWGSELTKAGPITNWKDLVDDDLHWVSNTDLAELAAMWWLSLDEHIYNGPSSQLTILSAVHSGTTVTVKVSQNLDTSDANYTTAAWTVNNAGGTARTVSAVTRSGNRTILITVSGELDGTPALTYGSQETAVGATVPRAVAVNLPATINGISSFGARLRQVYAVAILPAASRRRSLGIISPVTRGVISRVTSRVTG